MSTWELRNELVMFTLAAASLPLLLLESRWPAAVWLGWAIVAVFALDLSVRVWLAPQRWRYVRVHWVDVCIVVLTLLPILRPLRALRALQLLRLARFGLWAASGWRTAGRIWGDLHGKKLLIGAGIAATAAVAVVYLSESAEPDSSIHSVETTLWWAVTTVTTVGYGDTSPVTPEGRIAAAALMVAGISMFGLVTANVSARFISKHRDTTCPHCGRSPR